MQNPVLDGILQGLNMGMMLRRENLQQEAIQRQQSRLDREEELRDVEAQMRFARIGAKEVDETGMIRQPIRYDGSPMPGMIGADMIPKGAEIGETLRKPKAGQTVRYKGKAYEIPSEEEQQARALELYRERQKADDESRLNHDKALFDYKTGATKKAAAEVPRVDVMDPNFLKAVPIDQLGAVANLRRTLSPDLKMVNDYETGTPSLIGADPVTRQPVTVRDPSWAGASKPRPRQQAGGRGGGGDSSSGGGASDKATEKAREQARKDLDKLQQDEDAYHAEKLAIGAKLREGFPADKKDPNKATGLRRDAHARLVQLDALIKAKQTAKSRIIQRFGGVSAGDPLGVRSQGKPAGKKNDPVGLFD